MRISYIGCWFAEEARGIVNKLERGSRTMNTQKYETYENTPGSDPIKNKAGLRKAVGIESIRRLYQETTVGSGTRKRI